MKIRYIFLYTLLFIVFIGNLTNVLATDEPSISSESTILIEPTTSKTLYAKDSDLRLEPASVTKIMTAILTIENCNLNDIVTVPAEAVANIPSGYSIANLLPNEQLTVDSLLRLLMVYSANDAANALAFHLDGSISNFANRMNDKFTSLGLKDSHFTNPSGMHDPNHYSTAHDIALLMSYCIKNPKFVQYSSLKSCHIPSTNLSDERIFNNTNLMLNSNNTESYYEPLISTKTGFTSQAMYCLSSFAKKDNLSLICVILHSDSSAIRFAETRQLFEYGFNNFTFKDIVKKGDVVTRIDIPNATDTSKSLELALNDSINILTSTNIPTDTLSPQITLKDIPSAPIVQGTTLGTATYTINDKEYLIDLVALHNVDALPSTSTPPTSHSYFLQIVLLIIVILLLFVCLFWKKEKKN